MKARLPLLSCLSLLFITGCAPTGDWNQDTLFFSPRMGIDRLSAMRAEVDHIRDQTTASRQKTAVLESRLRQKLASKRATEAEHQALRREIEKLEADLAARRRELRRIDTENTDLSDQVFLIQTDISVMQSRLARLRVQLELAIRTR